jgi:hypothetical protein
MCGSGYIHLNLKQPRISRGEPDGSLSVQLEPVHCFGERRSMQSQPHRDQKLYLRLVMCTGRLQ